MPTFSDVQLVILALLMVRTTGSSTKLEAFRTARQNATFLFSQTQDYVAHMVRVLLRLCCRSALRKKKKRSQNPRKSRSQNAFENPHFECNCAAEELMSDFRNAILHSKMANKKCPPRRGQTFHCTLRNEGKKKKWPRTSRSCGTNLSLVAAHHHSCSSSDRRS